MEIFRESISFGHDKYSKFFLQILEILIFILFYFSVFAYKECCLEVAYDLPWHAVGSLPLDAPSIKKDININEIKCNRLNGIGVVDLIRTLKR